MANQVVGTGNVEIIFDYEKNLKNMLSNVKKEWDKVDISKRLDGIDKSLDNLTKKTNENTKATNDNAKAVKTKKDISEILKNNEIMLEKATKNSTNAQKEYIKTLQQQVKNGQELTGWQKERIKLLKEEDRNQNLNNLTLSAMAFSLKRAGDEMFNYTKNAVLFTAQLEKTMAVTGSVAGANKEELQQLTNAMLEMGTEVPVRFDKISESMYEMASAGLNTQEVLSAMPQVMKLAVGVGEDLNRTTELLISTVKSFDMSFEDSPRILDVFANSVAKSMATVEKLQVSFARVAPVAQNAGVSFEETTAILSKLYDLGLKGSNAGTVLGNVMTRLTTFTDQSTKALEKAGLSANDVSLEYNSLGESLAKITIAMKENKLGAEQLQYIFGTRGKIITDFLGQLKGDNVDELTKSYDELVKSISDASGAVDNFYGGQSETAQMALDKLKNSVDLFKVAIGEANKQALVPFASGLADIINGVAELSRSSKGMQTFIGILSGGTAVIGKSVSVLSSLGLAYVALKDIPWGLIATKIGLIKTALFSFNPIGLTVTATITALAGAFYLYVKRRRESEDADKKSKNAMSELKTIMEQNNGLLSSNIILTNDQIEAKKKLEKYAGTEINNLNELNKAIAENTRQTALNKAAKEQEKGAKELVESMNALGSVKSGAKNYKPSTSKNNNNTIWQDSNRSYESLVSSILTKYIPNWKKDFSLSFGYNSETGAFKNINNVIKKLEEVDSEITKKYVGLSNKTEEIRTDVYSGTITKEDKNPNPKPKDDNKDPKTGFDPISEAQKAVRDKIDQITRAVTQEARTSGKLVTEDELNQNINDAIKLAFKNQNIANTIASSAKGELSKDFKDFDWNKFSTAVQNEVYTERVKLFDPEDFNFTEFSKTVNDSLQTAKDYENNLNANIKGLKEASEAFSKAGDNKELKKQAQDSINSYIENINKNISLDGTKIDPSVFLQSLGEKSYAEVLMDNTKSITEAYSFAQSEAINKLKEQENKIASKLKEPNLSKENVAELERLITDVKTTYTALEKQGVTSLSTLNDINSTYNEELKTQFENSVRGLKNYYDSMISGIEDTRELLDDYANLSQTGKEEYKKAIALSLKNMGLSEEAIFSYIATLDTDLTGTKSRFEGLASSKISGIKDTEQYKNLSNIYKTAKEKGLGRALTQEEVDKTDKEFLDLALKLIKTTGKVEDNFDELADKIAKTAKVMNSLEALGSALEKLASTTGSSTIGGIASALSGGLGIATGVQTAISNVGVDAIAGIAGGLNAVSAGISLIQTLTDDSEIQADNEKNRQLWENSLTAMDEIKEILDNNFSSLISYTIDLVKNTTPTISNIKKGQSEIQAIATALSTQNKNFSDIIYTSSHTGRRGLKGNKTIQRTSSMDLQTLYSTLGYSGDVNTTATLDQLKSFAEQLKSMDLKTFNDLFLLDNEGLEDFDLQQANFTQLATQIQAYVDMLEKAQSQLEQFARLSAFADFTGFEVSDVDELYQSYIDKYEEMGVTITDSIRDYLYTLAEDNAITETITADVRDGFVDGWAQGQDSIEVLGSSLQSYFSGIMSNISKVFYDSTMNDFNDTLSKFYTDYAEGLAKVKELGLSPIDFANSQDYSSILNSIANAENLENNMKTVFETIRKQAEEAGISGVLIDEMLGDEYRTTIRDNISSAVSSGIMDGFNNGDITESDIKNSIFSTIVEQAMTDIIDNIMSENGVTSIVTQIVDALQSGDTAVLESLGISLTDSINAGLDESSATIEYLMGLLDKYSGENTKPIVFFDESNLDSIQQTMTDYENFSLSTNDNLPIIETTRRIEINITASGDLSDEALSKIAKEVASETKIEVSTSKYI